MPPNNCAVTAPWQGAYDLIVMADVIGHLFLRSVAPSLNFLPAITKLFSAKSMKNFEI